MRISVLDGYDCIGGNKILVTDDHDEGFLLDFGLNFSKWSMYFEEYLKPRTGKVLHDLLKLGLVPRINIYRKDLEAPEFARNERVHFLFLSHGHEDHTGLIGLISETIPILTTNETLAIISTSAEIRQEVWNELYLRKRQRSQAGDIYRSDVLKTEKKTFIKRGICVHNTFNDSGKLDENLFESYKLKDLWNEQLYVVPVYHSVIGASGLVTKVDDFWVAYTGDFRAGPQTQEEESFWENHLGHKRLSLSRRTENFFQFLKDKKPLLLITEGTTVSREQAFSYDERDVYENALEIAKATDKLVIVDFPIKHLERLMSFLRIAVETDRLLVLMPKDYAYLTKMGEIEPIWELSEEETRHLRIFHTAKSVFMGLEKEVMEKARDQGILLLPKSINERPSSYMLCAGYWEFQNILDLDEAVLQGSVYIHSSSEAYTEEQQMDFQRFGNWIKRFSIKTYGLEFDEKGNVRFTRQFHASGHISAEKLQQIIDEVDPDLILPVHTTFKEWFVERWGNRVILENFFQI